MGRISTINHNKTTFLLSRLFIVVLLVFFSLGGCDTEFDLGEDDDNTELTERETVEGTVVAVTPQRNNGLSNIKTVITNESDGRFIDFSDGSGFFTVTGNLSGMSELRFLDEDANQALLGSISVNVFPLAVVDLGNLRLDNGTVVLEDDVITSFEAEIIENNCSGNTGSIEVSASNKNTVQVDVQINNSTTIQSDDQVITCNDLLVGEDIQISGVLLPGNSVEAQVILR